MQIPLESFYSHMLADLLPQIAIFQAVFSHQVGVSIM